MYNMMTCEGGNWVRSAILGDCSQVWIALAVVLFLAMVARRQAEDGVLSGMGFSFIGALVGGLGLHILLTTFFGDVRWSLLGGIAGVAAGGFLIGQFTGGGDYGN